MIIGFEEKQIKNWKQDIAQYQRNKKTLYASTLTSPIIEPQIRKKPNLFLEKQMHKAKSEYIQANDILKNKYYPPINKYKHEKSYDILTNQSLWQVEENNKNKIKQLGPIRNLFNPINGQMIPQHYRKGRSIIQPKYYQKNVGHVKSREFDIVNLSSKNNNQQQLKQQEQQKKKQLMMKYQKNWGYNKIFNRFTSPEKQQQYWINKNKQDLEKSKQNYQKRLPISYQIRDRYIQDYSQPLTEGLIEFDRRQQNLKKGKLQKLIYQMKCSDSNYANFEKQQQKIKNKTYNLQKANAHKDQILPLLKQQKTIDTGKLFKNTGF